MADNELGPLDHWLSQQVQPLPPPEGTFELISKRARHRKIRKAVISAASAAAVAAAIAIAVPVGMSLHLTTSTNASLAAGNPAAPARSQQANKVPVDEAGRARPSAQTSVSGAAVVPGATTPGYLPPDYVPSSVTWDSLSTGWVMGPAGTPGHCANANPDICTSVARTDDGGQTWRGLPAPGTGGPMSATGVTGLRFLNATYGWAFGPELWATDNGGEQWHPVNTGGLAVTDLETASGRGYALFGNCAPPGGMTGDTIANCTRYTLKTAVAGSDTWTPVAGIPADLAAGSGQRASAVIELTGPTSTRPATGYLVAPDGSLYAGPLDGSAWHKVAKLPCGPGGPASDGLPQDLLLAAGSASSGSTRLALFCALPAASPAVYLSTDNGASWKAQPGVGAASLTADIGVPRSLTSRPDGTLILATTRGGQANGGIYLLSPGATRWQAASLSDPSGKTYGFTYVGMTSAAQGVALGGNPDLHAIWMTSDGGATWQVRPIKS